MTSGAAARLTYPASWFDRETLRRVLRDLLADQRSAITRRTIPAATILCWSDDTRLDEDGIGFDSLALLEAAQRANEFFHLHEVGIEDYLLVRRTLGDWLDIIGQSLSVNASRLTFRTSGSTGEPKRCTHRLLDLCEEVDQHAEELCRRGARRIVSLVPAHHIYGFLFTALLPKRSGLAIADARDGLLAVRRHLAPGDVVIATPFLWSLVARGDDRFPEKLIAVTSTAPMPANLRDRLSALGIDACLEIYGSTETAAIGTRWQSHDPFRLMPYWRRESTGLSRRSADMNSDDVVIPPDELAWHGTHHVLPVRRSDGAVQIGGVNVHPERISAVIGSHPGVAVCHVGCDREGTGAAMRLVALVVPRRGVAEDLQVSLEQYAAAQLSPPERPVVYRIVGELPRNALGKIGLTFAQAG